MPRQLNSQCDLAHPRASLTKYAPGNIFNTLEIPISGHRIIKEEPMKIARELIKRGLVEIKKTNTRVARIWKRLTGHDS